MQSLHPHDRTFPAQISRQISPYLAGPWFALALVAMMLVTYAFDLITPLGVPIWLFYFIPIILSFWSNARYAVPTVCVVTLLFLAAGFIFSPPGIHTTAALFTRIVFSVVFIVISAVLWMIRLRQHM